MRTSNILNLIRYIYISHCSFNVGNASLFVCLHGYAVVCASCATKQTFSQCIIFLEVTLRLTVNCSYSGNRSLGPLSKSMWWSTFFYFIFFNVCTRHEAHRTQCTNTLSVKCRLIITDTKPFATVLGVRLHYRHFLDSHSLTHNITFRAGQENRMVRMKSPTLAKARWSANVLWHVHVLKQTL